MSAASNIALDAAQVGRSLKRIAMEIAERNGGADNVVLVGIVRRGATIAERIALELRANGKRAPGDPRLLGRDIPFSLDAKRVVLVDDVLYTGRTVRAALDAISDLGRAESVQLAVLVDRGDRELPIRADYVGKNIQAPRGQRVYVRLTEIDGADAVVIGNANGK